MNRSSIICPTGPNAASFVKSCWLCRLILSCRQPEMPVCRRVHAVFCYPPLCIKWRYENLVHAHSVHLVAFTPQYFHLVHELLSLMKRFFIVLVRYLFLNHAFFSRPSPFSHFFLPLPPSTSSALLPLLHLSPHPTFIFHLAQGLLVFDAVQRIILGVVACVVHP